MSRETQTGQSCTLLAGLGIMCSSTVCRILVRGLLALTFFGSNGFAGEPRKLELGLSDFIALVLERNDSLHVRLLEFEINRRRQKGEWGAFEPELVLNYDRVENERQNTAEQRRSSGVAIFNEKNNLYSGGLEALVPTGARVRLGYTLRDLRNNLQDPLIPPPPP